MEEGRRKREEIVLIDVICYAKVLLDSRKVLPLQIDYGNSRKHRHNRIRMAGRRGWFRNDIQGKENLINK